MLFATLVKVFQHTLDELSPLPALLWINGATYFFWA